MTRWRFFVAAMLLLPTVIGFLASAGCGSPRGPLAIDADAPTEFTKLESGVEYRILRKSNGPKPGPRDKVVVDYSGWLDNETIFDSSYNRGQPTTFRVNQVIEGWQEGLQYVSEGGMIELKIPSHLAYGAVGRPGIPPHSNLNFKVELHQIQK